jgi:hypothetical protein
VPWYAVTTMLGATILGVPVSDDLMGRLSGLLELPVYRATFWERAGTLFRPFVWPFILGSTLGALVLAVLAYAVVSRLIMRVRQPASP